MYDSRHVNRIYNTSSLQESNRLSSFHTELLLFYWPGQSFRRAVVASVARDLKS